LEAGSHRSGETAEIHQQLRRRSNDCQ
jgi:hypothetical protein